MVSKGEMNENLKIFTIVALAVVTAAMFTASAYAYMNRITTGTYATHSISVAGTYGYAGGMMGGHGMMGGNGYIYTQPTAPTEPTQPITPIYPTKVYGEGCGVMNRAGYVLATPTTTTQINVTKAVTIAQNYVGQLNNPNLAVGQVEEYTQNFYVQVVEKNTGMGAFELQVDKVTGSVSAEMGPNMMWNTKYSVMSTNMMGIETIPTAKMPVNESTAKSTASNISTTI